MNDTSITKSDFLTFLDAPLHLWALKHNIREAAPSPLHVLMMNQGYLVEKHAKVFLEEFISSSASVNELHWQQEFRFTDYTLRTDALIKNKETGSYSIYEIKSGTSAKKDYLYDVAFQYHILSQQIQIDRVFILHLNKEYIRHGGLDVDQLFVANDVTDKMQKILGEVEIALPAALAVAQAETPGGIAHCYKPKTCACPSLCHPDLPEESIYEIPGLRENKKKMLLGMGILEIKDLPEDFKLSERQRQVADVVKAGRPYTDSAAISREFKNFEYPLYFLDYESCISALPLFDGYHAQQQIVFQYSLHRIDSPGTEPVHTAYLSTENLDPTESLLTQLSQEIGQTGTVFVWNKTFEMTRHKEMALMHPEYADFLEDINSRVYDLGDFVKNGWYLHPDFEGRWSIKYVLPVMVPELSYQALDINNGEMASVAWWEITQVGVSQAKVDAARKALLEYCELDTLAMVKIFEKLSALI